MKWWILRWKINCISWLSLKNGTSNNRVLIIAVLAEYRNESTLINRWCKCFIQREWANTYFFSNFWPSYGERFWVKIGFEFLYSYYNRNSQMSNLRLTNSFWNFFGRNIWAWYFLCVQSQSDRYHQDLTFLVASCEDMNYKELSKHYATSNQFMHEFTMFLTF